MDLQALMFWALVLSLLAFAVVYLVAQFIHGLHGLYDDTLSDDYTVPVDVMHIHICSVCKARQRVPNGRCHDEPREYTWTCKTCRVKKAKGGTIRANE